MSNNKLYTEEQIAYAFEKGRNSFNSNISVDEFVERLNPIELPSDEEIKEMGNDVIIYNDTKRGWFIEGLKFMRDKIQGGNNEQ